MDIPRLKAENRFLPVIVGLSDKHSVMVDFDDTSFKKVVKVSKLAMKHFRLEGFIVLKSSHKHYHVVFDKPIRSWSNVLQIISWIGIMCDNPNVWKWACMQAIKGSCTLRVSEKPSKDDVKPKPRIVYRYGKQNKQIKSFLEKRKEVWNILKRLRFWLNTLKKRKGIMET